MAQTKPTTPIKTSAYSKPQTKENNTTPIQFVFGKSNYRMLIIAIAVVILGFILMSGTTDIYSDTKIVIAPIVVLAGFALGFVAILKKPSAE
ncbi:MAG TPA: DUF3098 domain-containing protein [Mucilaginibacter sp.]|jgi:hypothetical protein|nr:DUF3098 domain-containing protein [Mucilaginibacter sp.]